jgi:ribosome biogenesis GTPase A
MDPIKFDTSKDLVIFQGFTGVGKSSTILTLAG